MNSADSTTLRKSEPRKRERERQQNMILKEYENRIETFVERKEKSPLRCCNDDDDDVISLIKSS